MNGVLLKNSDSYYGSSHKEKKMTEKKSVKLPIVSLPIKAVEARIMALDKDILLTNKTIKDATLMRSSLRGGIIELQRLIKEYQPKEDCGCQ